MTVERATTLARWGPALLAALALLLAADAVGGKPRKPDGGTATVTMTPEPPVVRDTPANLQAAFAGEMNAKERYGQFAKQADLEGYPAVARLFRACAKSEEAHGRRHVEAIALTNASARAVLDRIPKGTTEENLRQAIAGETWESEQFYPALIEKARADGRTQAVRGMTYALAAEREHRELLTRALETLSTHAAATPLFVCPTCGNTVTAVGFPKCPNCFSPARRYQAIS